MINLPTISQLVASLKTSLETNYGITIPSTGKNFLRALINTLAAQWKQLYLVIGNLQKNIWVDTADPESKGGTLERFGRVKLNRDPFPPSAGVYTVTVTGVIGGVIKAATTWKGNDENTNPGFLYVLDSEYTLVSTSDTITLRALTTGVESKLFVDEKLTATTPIALVNSVATVASITDEAQAAETIEAYRQKILESFRLEPQGGARTDLRLWSYDAQGVQQVYPYAKSNESAVVDLYIEATADDSIDGKGTPSTQLIEDVEAVIEFDPDETIPLNERGRRPIGIFQINYLPVGIKEIDIVINDYQGLTVDIETTLEAALTSMIKNMRPFIDGADDLTSKNDILDNNKVIGTIIAQQPGSVFGAIEIYVDGVLYSTYTFDNGNIPSLNSVTYA